MSLNPNSLSAALDMYELCVSLKGLLREARSSSPTEFCNSRAASLLRTCCSPFIFSQGSQEACAQHDSAESQRHQGRHHTDHGLHSTASLSVLGGVTFDAPRSNTEPSGAR